MTLRRPRNLGAARGREWSIKQQKAFGIFNLRGLWHLCGRLSAARRNAVQALIDQEIVELGAEAEGPRQQRRRAEMEARWAAEDAEREEMPF